jgi:hypothetical protein
MYQAVFKNLDPAESSFWHQILPIYQWNQLNLAEIGWLSKYVPGRIRRISPKSGDFFNPGIRSFNQFLIPSEVYLYINLGDEQTM